MTNVQGRVAVPLLPTHHLRQCCLPNSFSSPWQRWLWQVWNEYSSSKITNLLQQLTKITECERNQCWLWQLLLNPKFYKSCPHLEKTNQQKRIINLFKQVSMSFIGIGKPFCKLPTFSSNASMARCATSVEASSNTCSMEASPTCSTSWGPSSREGVGDGKGVGGEGNSRSDSLSLWPLLLNGNCSKFNEQNLNTKPYILSSWKRCYLMLPSLPKSSVPWNTAKTFFNKRIKTKSCCP